MSSKRIHYTADVDSLYTEELETADDFLERMRQKNIKSYAVKIFRSGQWAEIKIFPEWKKRSFVPHKGNTSDEKKAAQNKKDALRKLTRLLNHNYECYRDWFCTFTCDNNHLCRTGDECYKQINRAMNRIRYRFKKAGKPFVAVYKVEIKKARDRKGFYIKDSDGTQLLRGHLHIVFKAGVDIRTVNECWQMGNQKKSEVLRYYDEGFARLAAYFIKDTESGRRRWNCTTNLKAPPPPKVLYSSKAGRKSKVRELAINENLHKEYFENILQGYRFVDSEAKTNEYNNGVYLYARLARR